MISVRLSQDDLKTVIRANLLCEYPPRAIKYLIICQVLLHHPGNTDQRGKPHYTWPPCTNRFSQVAFYTIYFFRISITR
jgi:hypothetical protein